MIGLSLKKSLLSAAAAAMALGSAAPAFADGGGHHGRHGYHGHGGYHHAYKRHHHGRYYYGSRHYRHGRGHLSGAEAAFIALGIVGGVVLIDRALEREQNRYAYEPRYAPPPRDSYYRRDDRPLYDDELDGDFGDDGADDGALDGAGYRAGESRYNYGAAYNDCKAETRDAARDSGVIVSLPAKPQRIQPIDNGAAVRFTADYIAQDGRGEWRRTMVCEADENGVRFLELV